RQDLRRGQAGRGSAEGGAGGVPADHPASVPRGLRCAGRVPQEPRVPRAAGASGHFDAGCPCFVGPTLPGRGGELSRSPGQQHEDLRGRARSGAGAAERASLAGAAVQRPRWRVACRGNDGVVARLFTVQKALPLLRDGASIIFTSSIVGSKGNPAVSVYSATKAALRSFARTLTTDLKDRKIRVNVVSPGAIDTEGLRGLRHTDSDGLNDLFATGSRSAASVGPMTSPAPCRSSPRRTAATSPASSCSS